MHTRDDSARLRAADLFCGAGGTTTGAEQAGVKVVLAVNHWRTAIYSHQANHPETRHICARIDDIDPRHDKTLPEFDILMASPECTHHSIARGGRPIDDQKRATPWHVCVWAEAKRPRWLVIENVREFRDWGPLDAKGRPIKAEKGKIFRQWVKSLEAIGYQVDHQILNAADFGAATKRLRLFIVARRGHAKRDIPWPEITHPQANWRPAWSIIDWSKPCPSIFGRKRPLAEKTLRRIEVGLRKFVGQAAEPFVVRLRASRAGLGEGGTTHGVDAPLGTITAGGQHHALAVPFQFKALGRNPGLTKGIDTPVPTIVAARENHAIVMPFISHLAGPGSTRADGAESLEDPTRTILTREDRAIVQPFLVPHFGERDGQEPRSHAIEDPLPTVTGQGAGSLAVPFVTMLSQSGSNGGRNVSVEDPLGTITTAKGGERALVLPFLTKYYGTGSVQPTGEPLDTVTTRDRFGLAMASLIETMRELHVIDIGFRMLDVDELARAQGFPEGYYMHGTRAEQVKQIGNSVSPPVAAALCRAIAEAA